MREFPHVYCRDGMTLPISLYRFYGGDQGAYREMKGIRAAEELRKRKLAEKRESQRRTGGSK